jgi:hypothetical protein
MIQRFKRPDGRRGVALLIVLGLLATLFVYAVAVQIAVQSGVNQSRALGRTLRQRAAIEAALATAAAWKAPREEKMQAPGLPADTLQVAVQPFDPADPSMPRAGGIGIAPLPGDVLVKIVWLADPKSELRYVVNQEGRRRGTILLP